MSPPKLCKNGEKAYGYHSPAQAMPRSSGYSKSPDALMAASASLNSAPLQGSSSDGTRMPYFSKVERRVVIATAASHKPTE